MKATNHHFTHLGTFALVVSLRSVFMSARKRFIMEGVGLCVLIWGLR